MLHWGNARVPVDFEIVRRKEAPKSRLENAFVPAHADALSPSGLGGDARGSG